MLCKINKKYFLFSFVRLIFFIYLHYNSGIVLPNDTGNGLKTNRLNRVFYVAA